MMPPEDPRGLETSPRSGGVSSCPCANTGRAKAKSTSASAKRRQGSRARRSIAELTPQRADRMARLQHEAKQDEQDQREPAEHGEWDPRRLVRVEAPVACVGLARDLRRRALEVPRIDEIGAARDRRIGELEIDVPSRV